MAEESIEKLKKFQEEVYGEIEEENKDIKSILEWDGTGKLKNIAREAKEIDDKSINPKKLLETFSVRDLKKVYDLDPSEAKTKQTRSIEKSGSKIWKFIVKIFRIFRRETQEDKRKYNSFVKKIFGSDNYDKNMSFVEKIGMIVSNQKTDINLIYRLIFRLTINIGHIIS